MSEHLKPLSKETLDWVTKARDASVARPHPRWVRQQKEAMIAAHQEMVEHARQLAELKQQLDDES